MSYLQKQVIWALASRRVVRNYSQRSLWALCQILFNEESQL